MSSTKTAGQKRRAVLKAERGEARRWRDVVTPEGANLRLRLADVGERAGALLIDLGIMFGIMIAGFLIIWVGGITSGSEIDYGILFAMFTLFFFFVRNFYFIVFEIGRRGATPGKRATGLRVMSRDGGQLTANAVLARNFMRELEVFLPLSLLFSGGGGDRMSALITLMAIVWVMLFVCLPFFNRDRLRAGDIIAGTWVIRAPKTVLKADLANGHTSSRSDGFAFSDVQLDAYGEHELKVLETVLRESSAPTQSDVADRIRSKIDWVKSEGETDDAFLQAYYRALRERLETRLLFGNRKRDKFDSTKR